MARQWSGRWAGGRIHTLDNGKQRWVLERSFGGRQHTITLAARDEQGALAALHAWTEDPAAFIERRRAKRAKDVAVVAGEVVVTEALLAELEANIRRRGLSDAHRKDTLRYCRQWRADLGEGADWRQVTRAQVQRCLDVRGTARQHRIVALKVLAAFLVDTGRLEGAESPGRHVDVPVARPARLVKPKGYSAEAIAACYRGVDSQAIRDVFRLQACYGMHGSEVRRIASGEAGLQACSTGTGIAGVVTFLHKSGRLHSISLDAKAFAAAQRLQATGGLPLPWRILEATKAAGGLHPSQLRHSFVQLGQRGRWVYPEGQGVSVEELTEVTGHSSSITTRTFYDGGVPRMLVLSFSLEHPQDPVTP
jgi:integrase